MNVSDAISATQASLAGHTCPDTDALREAQALVCHVLGITREEALTYPERELDIVAGERLEGLVARRLAHEPLAYLLGTAPFLGRDFEVTPATLIPRPATEVLVRAAVDEGRMHPAGTICVDVGTGSGCIAVTLAAELPYPVIATDISSAALDVARRNAERNDVADRVTFMNDDGILVALSRIRGHDLIIVGNLPYIPTSMMHSLTKEVRCEPDMALDGGKDGLDLYRVLLSQIDELGKVPVVLFAEMLPEQTLAFSGLALEHGFTDISDIQNDADVSVGVRCVKG